MSEKESFIVDEKFLELFGTGSLTGRLKLVDGKWPDEIELLFPQSSLSWREKNGGPDQYIVNEYAIRCLLDDVLNLQSRGIKIILKDIPRP